MEILEILKNPNNEIYSEDLDFFETELATGDYTESYIAECKEQIKFVRKQLCGGNNDILLQPKEKTSQKLVMGIHDVAPETASPVVAAMSAKDIVFSDIKLIREDAAYKTEFKNYIKNNAEIDVKFIDEHYSFFTEWELNAVLSVKQLGEDFLEKYFGALDKTKIARYQCFSESFFMKHYSQLDTAIVLTKGKNEWCKKEKRSKQLDVFLRLKGVKL